MVWVTIAIKDDGIFTGGLARQAHRAWGVRAGFDIVIPG